MVAVPTIPVGNPASLYIGTVSHRRLRPRRHTLKYRVAWLCLDLDRLGETFADLRLISHNRFNLFGFYDRDHGPADGGDLRIWVDAVLAEAGFPRAARIELLCLPRMLGYVFDPISVFLCRDAADAPFAVLYQVRNTFGERHVYRLPARLEGGAIRHGCDKRFYVSPFFDVAGRYAFLFRPPGERVTLGIRYADERGGLLNAVFSGRQEPLSDASLARMARSLPLLPFKVMAGIHVEALRLWLKGMRLTRKPAPPDRPISGSSDPLPAPTDAFSASSLNRTDAYISN